ncbi:succinate dehydrogenase cytochrome b558 subunit [Paenibacillus sp. SC116]|uniref:succinate dehydrogenase cytochrome b558 subunit n=1 Tax=Paenibacillus sp. SC116 TaxID=2968986 RepID=UPI00215AF787|nr:succinate dehydrogenase cytochrome b558 subunit [Paenibacillus sp. SC116]MCR8846120.1 succinate dehydrogenase cytochrome b558 subunit [Paenibacillus sp. SC116]
MKRGYFYSRKLHSLLGVIPLGFFMITHMVSNFSAFEGGLDSFQDKVALINGLPLVLVLEIFGIWLPLLYHGVYGLYIAYTARNNVGNFNYGRNFAFLMQRITGVITFIFVTWHVYETRVQIALGNLRSEDLGTHMNSIFANPFMLAFYVVGAVAASYHFANGLWAFFVSWGITVGPRSQKVFAKICMGLFVVMSVLFVLAIVGMRQEEFEAASAIFASAKSVIG